MKSCKPLDSDSNYSVSPFDQYQDNEKNRKLVGEDYHAVVLVQVEHEHDKGRFITHSATLPQNQPLPDTWLLNLSVFGTLNL